MTNNNHLKANGYSAEEEDELLNMIFDDVISNPRWYLNNLYWLKTFRVSWGEYRANRPVSLKNIKQ